MAAAEFHLGGHVPPDSPAYVERAFVDQCFTELSAGRWVVLLGPRQHGKTSGLVRLVRRLREAGVATALVSLQGIPNVDAYRDLLSWIARKIAAQLDVSLAPPAGEDASELDAWLARALPEEPSPVAVLLDEAAGVQDEELRSDLYRQLRRLHDERDGPAVPNLGRSFSLLFSGTFEPKRLVADDLTSPFNVCRRIESEDLTVEGARSLVREVGAEQAHPFVDRAFELVGGQPLLLQTLLSAAESGDVASSADEQYESVEQRLLVGDSDHLSDLISAVVSDPALRGIAEQVVQDERGAPFAADPEHRMLITLGLARLQADRLVPRNALYARVAADHPALSGGKPPPAGARIAPLLQGAFDFVTDPYLRTFAEEMVGGAYAALNDGHLRLALIGFGSALEAVLIDVLEQTATPDRDAAKQKAKPNFTQFEDQNDPNTWRLVNLIAIARKLPAVDSPAIQGAHALRQLRNYVHPAEQRAGGQPEAVLQSEFDIAQAILTILVRDLS